MAETERLNAVLDATYVCLSRYGMRRTTMDDIASAMGVSRSAVYQYVRGKDDAFRRLVGRLHTRALDEAGRVAATGGTPAEHIRGILRAKLDLVLRLVADSPHAGELLDEQDKLFGDICAEFTATVRGLLVTEFTEASAGTPADAADICVALIIGLESTPDGARLFDPAVDALLAGLLPPTAGTT